MERSLIARGVLAGAVAGLVAWVFALILIEPVIDAAISYEGGAEEAYAKLDGIPGSGGEPLVSRAIQGNLGIGVGMVAFGIAMGALVAVAYALCLGRTGGVRPRPLALLVAAAGFLTIFALPFAKYPTSPPAASTDDTIRDRGTLFLVVLAVAVLGMIVAVVLGQALRSRFGTWNAAVLAGGGYLALIVVLFAVLPPLGHLGVNVAQTGFERSAETPLPIRDAAGTIVFPGYPADVLAEFRVYSLGAQLLLWGTLGLVFAPLADRALQRSAQGPPTRADAGV